MGSSWKDALRVRKLPRLNAKLNETEVANSGESRHECVDHMVVLGEAHLRRMLNSYARYYNESRIHRSLSKDAPFPRAIERLGVITSRPVLGGIHYQYCRI
jgi:hypothetical protein